MRENIRYYRIQQSEGVRFLLIRHSKYTPTDRFFGEFAQWDVV